MKVSTETKTMVHLALTEQEEKAFRQTVECIEFLCSTFEKEGILFSPATGEVISTFELRRMLGMLNGLEGSRCWEFLSREENE